MATGAAENKMKSDDFRHTCGLCMEPYSRGRSPKLLPCFHTFCLPCLTSLAENVTSTTTRGENRGRTEEEAADTTADGETRKGDGHEEAADTTADGETGKGDGHEETAVGVEEKLQEEEEEMEEENEDGEQGKGEKTRGEGDDDEGKGEKASDPGDVFLCPTCRAPVTVPKGGVAALQTNFYLDVDDTEDPPCSGPALCEMCEEGQQQEATHSCRDCQQRMCRSCRHLHDRVSGARDHRVQPIAIQPPSKPEVCAVGNKLCQFHPGQALCFHCCKCDISICLHCKLTSHEGHETEDMATAALRAKEELAAVMAKARNQLRSVEACISRLERDELDLKRQKLKVMQQVASRFDVIIAWATQARDEVLETLAAKVQISMHDIRTEKASALVVKETILGIVARASRKTKLGPELLLMKNELQVALLNEDTFDRYKKLGDRSESLTFLKCVADPSTLDLGMLRVCIGQMMDGEETEAREASLPTFHQLATTVSKLEAELKDLSEKAPGQVPKVSFHAMMTDAYSYNSGQSVVFNAVECNEGGGYNDSNGFFTAPVTGTYVFMATVRNNLNGDNSIYYLNVKGGYWGYIDTPDSSTVHAVASLNKGEQVWVQAADSYTCRPNSTMFSGALVSI